MGARDRSYELIASGLDWIRFVEKDSETLASVVNRAVSVANPSTWPNHYSERRCVGFTVYGSVVETLDSHANSIGFIARKGNRPTYGLSSILQASRKCIRKSEWHK